MKTNAVLSRKIDSQPRIKSNYVGLLYILPWIVGFLIFQLYPLLSSLVYSFTDLSLLKAPSFVGLSNYFHLLTQNPDFTQSLKVTTIYVLIAVPGKLIFALIIALILNMKLKYINFFRTIYYMPSILGGSVALAVLWRYLFAHNGLINIILAYFSIPAVNWLGSPDIALYTLSLLDVWQFGSSMVLFLAGLKQIPAHLYEAARVDGANKIIAFFKITLPMLSPIIFFNLIMQMIHAFQTFTGAFVITNGGPLKATYLYGLMLYEYGFKFFKMGYACALSWILFVIMIALTMLVFKSSPYWTYYDDEGDF